jgi:hypothetical protein
MADTQGWVLVAVLAILAFAHGFAKARPSKIG